MSRFGISFGHSILPLRLARQLCWQLIVVLSAFASCNGALAETGGRKPIIVGSEIGYPPYAIVTPDGAPDGFSVDLIKAVGKVMGVEIEFRVATWNVVKGQLERGEIDLLPHVYYSRERDAVFDFSAIHTSANAAFFVRSGEFRDMTIQGASGKSIIAMRSDWTHEYLVKQGMGDNLVLVDTVPDALRRLAAGNHNVAFLPHLVGLLVKHNLDLGNVETVGNVVPVGRGFAFAVTEGNRDLQLRLNEALAIVRASGRYDEIYEKWFGHLSPEREEYMRLIKYVVFVGVTIILVIGGWTVLLRRQVKRRTRELEGIKANLEQRVEERTADLQDSEEGYRNLVELSHEGIIVHVDGKIVFCNRAFAAMVGTENSEEIVGRRALNFVPPEELLNVSERRKQAAEGKARSLRESNIMRLDGSLIPVERSMLYITWEGKPSFLVLTRDISERKESEAEKAQLDQQTRQAQKMESIGTLAGGIAHELNNMLMPVQGLTELAMEDVPEDSRARKNMGFVLQSAKRAGELVDKILSFSHQDEAERKPVDLRGVVDEQMGLLGPALPATIHIRLELDDEPFTVLADETQIHQVLMNLASNAAHAVGGKVGELTIGLSAIDLRDQDDCNRLGLEPARYAKLSVGDTGHGMDKATMERIFEPFFTTKEVGEGTGMGLAMIHGIVTGHGGAIDVSSEPGAGTTFDIYLPLAEEREPALAGNG